MDNLVPWNKIEHQIDEARDLKTITQMQAQVEAIKIIVKQRGGSLKAQNKCSRYRICLEQKAGNIYKQAPDETGKRTDLTSGSDSPKLTNRKQIIKDTGKDKKTFHKWAKESEIKEDKILEYEGQCNEKEEELTTAGLLKYAQPDKPKENILAPIKGTHEVIVIDPPWPYGTEYNQESRRVASPYKELSLEQLEQFKLPTADSCVLWLWTTHKFLHPAFHLLDAWEFDYKLTFVWDKVKMGMGVWLRCQVEFCLLATKGKPRWNLINERDLLSIARGKHSVKPDKFYNMVEKLCPTKGKYADIFSRKERPGWKSYGNEVK